MKFGRIIVLALTLFFSLSLTAGVLASISGDANKDKKVNGLDYVVWFNNYKKEVTQGASQGDFNNDGEVNGLDYVVWFNSYQQAKADSADQVESTAGSSRCVELFNKAEGLRFYDTDEVNVLKMDKEYALTPKYVGPDAPYDFEDNYRIVWYAPASMEPYLKIKGAAIKQGQQILTRKHTVPVTIAGYSYNPNQIIDYHAYLTVKVQRPFNKFCKARFHFLIEAPGELVDPSPPPVVE